MMPPRRSRLRLVLLALPALGGCRMIDQRSFERTPPAPDPTALARPVPAPLPTARLRLDDPGTQWQTTLGDAVQQAIDHNPDAAFDLLTPIPTAASRAEQDRFAAQGVADAQTVAAALQQDGVDAARITLGYQGDAGKPVREVRVYVH